MSKSSVKTNKVTGFRIAVMIISILLLAVIMSFSMLLGISSFKHNGPVVMNNDATTVRKRLPTDGSVTPTSSEPIDNIGYMAYVLDNQPFYDVYAYNSTKSTGYEQVTQSWKDYKNAELSGAGQGVMVCSDLSYSALVKSATQSCFIGDNEAHIRSGNKPAKNSKPLDIDWAKGKPSIYDKEKYKYEYGEFSTEISVYVINEDTLAGADEVIDNGDGTYSQKYYLNESAGCWYQYGMKTRGGLKDYPVFKKIEITFTFDSSWRVLESYCEEKTTISPRALGGMNMDSTSKTTTTFNYTEEGFDNAHFAYFDSYFKGYVGSKPSEPDNNNTEPDVLEILGSGFNKVLSPAGQQFRLDITLGETAYDGIIYAQLSDIGNVLTSLDARLALEKRGSGKQDFYAEFKGGDINVYYGADFALTANMGEMSESLSKIISFVKSIGKNDSASAVAYAAAGEESSGGGLDVSALLQALKLEISDTSAIISLQSDDLLGLGLGIDASLEFARTVKDDGDLYDIKNVDLKYVKYNGTAIDVIAAIAPDDGAPITREPATTPANLKDYADSIYNILSSNTIKAEIGLEDKLIEGLTLDAEAYLKLGSSIAADVSVAADYKGISLKLDASYVYSGNGYGKVYLRVTEVNGKAVDAKVYSDISDTVKAVKDIIDIFSGSSSDGEEDKEDAATLADIVNRVLNLNLAKVIGKVSGNASSMSVEVNVDELLKGLDVSLGFNFGVLSLGIDRTSNTVSGNVSSLGLNLGICGSEAELPLVGDTEGYVDVTAYINSVARLLKKPAYDVKLELKGTKISDKIDLSKLTLNATATAAVEGKDIRVKLPVTATYDTYSLELTAYYTVNLDSGNYGKIYLNVTKINDKAIDAKISCDIKDTVASIQELIAKFKPAEPATVSEEEGASILSKAIETVLKLDYNEIISATNEKFAVTLDVDEILSGLDISLGGIKIGALNLEYTTADSVLKGKLEKLGLDVTVSGNETALEQFVLSNYVDLNTYLDSVNALLNKPAYDVKLELKGTKISDKIDLSKLTLNATATAAVEGKDIRVKLPVTAKYDTYSLELTAYYTINLDSGNYGNVYLNVTKINDKVIDAKICCDIKDTVASIQELITKFKPAEPATVSEEEGASILSKAIETVLKLDFNEIISATNEKLSVTLDVDEILSGLDISLGGIKLGTLNLEYTTTDSVLKGKLEKLGLNVTVSGNETALEQFVLSNYVDLNTYLDSVNALLNKNSYDVTLSFVGNNAISSKADLTGLTVDASAKVGFKEGYGGLGVDISALTVTYKGLTVVLSAHYEIDFNGSYGTVYLNVTKIGDSVVDAKVKLDIKDAVSSVTSIINRFTVQTNSRSGESGDGTTDIIGKVIGVILKLDFNELVTVTDKQATVTLDIDKLLNDLDLSLGLNLGTAVLVFDADKYELSATDTAIGLNSLKIVGSDEKLGAFYPSGYIDANAYLEGIDALVHSAVYELGLSFSGTTIKGVDLSGLNVSATAYAMVENGYNDITVYIPMTVIYCGLKVELSVYYTIGINNKDYGTAFIQLTSIDDTVFNAKLQANVKDAASAVKDIIDTFNTQPVDPDDGTQQSGTTQQSGQKAGASDIISKVVGVLISLDYPEIISCTQSKLTVTLDVDAILSELNISLGGVSFGTLPLELQIAADGSAKLSGSLASLGVTSLTLKGNDKYTMPAVPEINEYLDLTEIIKLVGRAAAEGKAIADARDAEFTVNATVKIDETTASIVGRGEVVWADNKVKVAVSLTVTVDDYSLDVNFIYDGAAESDKPFITLTLNGTGVKITQGETDKLVNSVKNLIDAFKKDAGSSDVPAGAPEAQSIEVGGKTLEEIITNANVKKALGKVLGFVAKFTAKLETVNSGSELYSLIIENSDGLTLTLGADDTLSLNLVKGTSVKLNATVSAGSGTTVSDIEKELSDEKTAQAPDGKYEYLELSRFVEMLYNKFFDEFEKVSLKELIGEPYLVTLKLTGANSAISALEGIKVNAELYYDEGVVGTSRETKLLEVKLDLDINGTSVLADVAYCGRTVYIALNKIGATALTGIKFKADVSDIFSACEQLVRLITDTSFVNTVNKLMGKGASSASDAESIALFNEMTAETSGEPSVLTKLLDAVLTLDFEKAFKFDKQAKTAEINIDSIAKALLGYEIGSFKAQLDSNKKTLSASVAIENKDSWISINAGGCARRDNAVNSDQYTDISFISTLISDVVNTLTDENKNVYDMFTFAGGEGSIAVDIDIPVLGNIGVRFDNTTLTVGFDNDKLYISLAASMRETKKLGMVVTANMDISVTYCDGLIVLGREIGTSNEKYKVVTIEYLLDNLLDKNNSPVRWLLGTSQNAWNLIADNVNLNIESGLTKPKVYTLYGDLQQTAKDKRFNLSDYITGMTVKAGEHVSLFGGGATHATEKFNLGGDMNHYAFDLNAKGLTGGTVTALCAVIRRSDDGIRGIEAYGEVGSMVKLSLNFNSYLEGVTDVYKGKVYEKVTPTEETFYDYVEVEAGKVTADDFKEGAAKYGKYYIYDSDVNAYEQAVAYEEGATYFEKVNTRYYVLGADGNYSIASEWNEGTQYYGYESGENNRLGKVAVRNYLSYVTAQYGFDRTKEFTGSTANITKIFGCFNTEDSSYVASDVLSTVQVDVYASLDAEKPERTVEVLYGSVVKLISEFPEFADENKTLKLLYVDKDGRQYPNSIVVGEKLSNTPVSDGEEYEIVVPTSGRIALYKSSEAAVNVVFNFVGVPDMKPVSAALSDGDELAEYTLNNFTFLGWFEEEELTNRITNVDINKADGNVLKVYGKYVNSPYAENGVIYTYDDAVNGYYVSGFNSDISKYYNRSDLWLEIKSDINGYEVKYIGKEAFANTDNDAAHSLVNVLVPATVTAVYERAFLDNKALRKVVFLADNIYFGGKADGNADTSKTSVFYGCYESGDISNWINKNFTVYYNGTYDYDPYSYYSAKIDPEWNRIYFKRSWGSNTIYWTGKAQSGWAFADFVCEVTDLNGNSSALPAAADLSAMLSRGVKLDGYTAQEFEKVLHDMLIDQLKGDNYDVSVSGMYSLDGKAYSVKIKFTQHELIRNDIKDINFTVKFGDETVYEKQHTVELKTKLVAYYTADNFTCAADYALIGWYTDAACTKLAPEVSGTVSALFGKAVPKTHTAENGVVYSFNEDMKCYYVSGSDAEKISAYRGESGANKWLKIAGSVNGYPVKYIGREAFSLRSKSEAEKLSLSLKNVLVPATVEAVYDEAFFDNKGLRNVVFLAEKVFFGGRADGTAVDSSFAWCFTSSDLENNQNKNLSVYYTGTHAVNPFNVATRDNAIDAAWNRIYFKAKEGLIGSDTVYTLKAVNSGWTYSEYEVAVDEEYSYLKDIVLPYVGLFAVTDSDEQIAANATAKINELTAKTENGSFIDGFDVVISRKTVGLKTTIVISLVEKSEGVKYSIVYGDGVYIEGLTGFNGKYYADAGSEYSIKPNAGLVIDSVSGVTAAKDGENYKFTMPAAAVEISVECSSKPVSVTFSSEIEFSMNGKTGFDISVEMQGGSAISEYVPEAANYTFLGWAYYGTESNQYVFEGVKQTKTEYKAVWAYQRSELTELSVSGNALTATVDTDKANSVYGWYTDSKFSKDAVAVCTDNVATIPNELGGTVLYARLKFKFTVNLEADDTTWKYTEYVDGNTDIKNRDYGNSISNNTFTVDDILEGYTIQLWRRWTNALVIKVYDKAPNEDNVNTIGIVSYMIKGFKASGYSKTNIRPIATDSGHFITLNSGGTNTDWAVNGGKTDSDYNYYFSDSDTLICKGAVTHNYSTFIKA